MADMQIFKSVALFVKKPYFARLGPHIRGRLCVILTSIIHSYMMHMNMMFNSLCIQGCDIVYNGKEGAIALHYNYKHIVSGYIAGKMASVASIKDIIISEDGHYIYICIANKIYDIGDVILSVEDDETLSKRIANVAVWFSKILVESADINEDALDMQLVESTRAHAGPTTDTRPR